MKKKLISALLMGALFVSSTSVFVSCKDYDDDINGLKSQINDLSTLVGTKESTIKNSISTLEAQLGTLKSTLSSELSTGDQATLIAAIEAIDAAKTELNRTLSTKANASDVASDVNALNQKNNDQDAAIIKAQTAADQALNQLEELIAAFTAASRGDNDSQSLADVQAAVASIKQMKSDLADLNSKYNSLSADVSKAIADIADLKTAVAGQQAALEALAGESGDMTQIAANIAAVMSKVSDLEKQMGNTGDKTVAEQIAALNKLVEDLEKKIGSSSNPELNTLTTALAKALRSLVFQGSYTDGKPSDIHRLYVDGIESIEYPYIQDSLMTTTASPVLKRQRTYGQFAEDYEKTIRNAASSTFPKLATLNDYIVKTSPYDIEYFGPAWPVTYHMNPSRSTTAWEDIKGWYRRDAEIITRSGAASSIVTAQTYADGTQLFNNESGILTVGLQINKPEDLAHHATPDETTGRPGKTQEAGTKTNGNPENVSSYQYDDMIALQVNSGKDTIITSDYAMIYPEKAYVEAIVWTKYHSKKDRSKVDFDEKCGYNSSVNHVWDSPDKALGAGTAYANVYPDIELFYNDEKGICLRDLLGIHLVRECKTISGKNNPYLINLSSAEFGRWGLSCEFQLVGYSIDGNITIDSNYATFTDGDEKGVSTTGTIKAQNVKEDGTTIETQSATSVDREPLVRVLVKRGTRVIKDGYILIHITRANPEQDVLVVDNYPEKTAEFDLCNSKEVFTTNWSEFSKYVLTDKLENMTKEAFDSQYGAQFNGVPDLMGTVQPIDLTSTPVTMADNSTRYDDVQLFNYNPTTKLYTKCTARDLPGYVRYYHNSIGTTNHRFEWILSDDELEEYTHERGDLPLEVTKYFRYTGKPGAKYEYIYVKMTVKLNRKTVAESGVKDKNKNYWYSSYGFDALQKDTFDVVVWNPWYPQDGGDTKTYQQDLVSTFAGNAVQFTTTTDLAANINSLIKAGGTGTTLAKYYFAPVNTEITAQNGQVYVITARKNYKDQKWNSFVCKYLKYNADGTEKVVHDGTSNNLHYDSTKEPNSIYKFHKWGTYEQNKKIHEQCAIDYNEGVYTNNKLYAVLKTNYDKSSYTADYEEIATLNQNIESGQMKLTWRNPDNDITKVVLNAIGYVPEHKNIIYPTGKITTEDGNVFDACKSGLLHTMVGIVAQNGCDVAVNVPEFVNGTQNTNAGTFYVSWQRPINVKTQSSPMVDAKNNGDFIYTVDFLKLYDWRGPVYGYMYNDQQWLWSYYNIKGLRVDTRPAQVYTNMHQSDGKFVKLSDVTTMAQFGVLKTDGTISIGGDVTIPINVTPYNAASKNVDILSAMGIDPVDNNKKLAFAGGLFYANNGDNVQQFDLKVPVYVIYDWGEFKSEVIVHIDRTLGH